MSAETNSRTKKSCHIQKKEDGRLLIGRRKRQPNAVKDAGFLYWTIIKPPLILENLLPSKSQMMYPTIAQRMIITPLDPEVKADCVSPNDIGRFAAEAFLGPEKFNRKEFAIVGGKLILAEVAYVLSAVTGKKFDAKRGTTKDKIVPGFFKLWVQSYEWQEVEGYKVDPQEAASFGIPTRIVENLFGEK